MRRLLLSTAALLGLCVAVTAAPDANLMDLSEGPWRLSNANGQSCPLTLGDMPIAHDARYLDGGGDCRGLDAALDMATGWRIDEPGELIFLNDNGKALLGMKFHRDAGTFNTSGHTPELTLEPAE